MVPSRAQGSINSLDFYAMEKFCKSNGYLKIYQVC